ncbi:hypothetical protein LIER_37921 [Lithospermum erythrorhizon]|uniref:Uncharacterized protein n=1 Tax=Lithospermum erythrorhizon TaxID=34254 RepID=A0AAV3PST9_LITER
MALKHVALIFLFALFLSSLREIQARDSQMFNKIPSKTNEVVVEVKQPQQNLPNKEATDLAFNLDQQQENEPNFIPENNYGLYGHESGQFSPTQTPNSNNQNLQTNPNLQNNFPNNAKYLPKNYNTVAYVTQPEDFNDNSFSDNGYTTNKNNNNYQTLDNSNNYNNAQRKDMSNKFDFMDNEEDTSVNDNTNKYYTDEANKNNNFNTRFMDDSETSTNNFNTRFMDDSETSTNNNFNTRFMGDSQTSTNNNNNYFNSGKSRVNRVEPQGMSDTRFMENGKYHYNINSGKYSRDHPYMNPMVMRTKYNPTGYSNIDNSYQYNNYNEEEQYQNEDNMP